MYLGCNPHEFECGRHCRLSVAWIAKISMLSCQATGGYLCIEYQPAFSLNHSLKVVFIMTDIVKPLYKGKDVCIHIL